MASFVDICIFQHDRELRPLMLSLGVIITPAVAIIARLEMP